MVKAIIKERAEDVLKREETEERKFKDVTDLQLTEMISQNALWAREVLSLLHRAAESELVDVEASTPPIYLLTGAMEKLRDAEEANCELWERYISVKEFVKKTPEFKKEVKKEFKKMKESAN